MFFKTAPFVSAVALFLATNAMGAAVDPAARDVSGSTLRHGVRAAAPGSDVGEGQVSILIATDPYFACNCPNNCSHKDGSSCKYYSGPSDSSDVISGTCVWRDSQLTCVA